MSKFNVHQALVVTVGKFRGLVGTVTACEDRANTVWLHIEGVVNDKPISKNLSFSFNNVRAL